MNITAIIHEIHVQYLNTLSDNGVLYFRSRMTISRVHLPSVIVFLVSSSLTAIFTIYPHQLRGVQKHFIPSHETLRTNNYKDFLASKHAKKVEQNQLKTNQSLSGVLDKLVVDEHVFLHAEVPLLCVVLVGGGASLSDSVWRRSEAPNAVSGAQAIVATWGSHCMKTVYYCTEAQEGVDCVVLERSQNADSWTALREVLLGVSSNYLDDYKWFMFAQEDTYVIPENLLYYVSVLKATDSHYLGHAVNTWGVDYNMAGPGIVMSHEALRRLYDLLLKNQCTWSSMTADYELGICMSLLGIPVTDTRDNLLRGRFLAYQPETLLVPGVLPWLSKFSTDSKYPISEGPDCCSDHSISFHYVPPNLMYVFEYFVYHLKPYGLNSKVSLPTNFSHSLQKLPWQSNSRRGHEDKWASGTRDVDSPRAKRDGAAKPDFDQKFTANYLKDFKQPQELEGQEQLPITTFPPRLKSKAGVEG